MPSNYRADLAFVHHAGFGGHSLGAAPALLAALRRAGVRDGRVVDLGCGSGLWLRELARRGYDAVGVDSSRAMLDIARRVARGATLHRASAHRFAIPSCDAVTALGEVLCYLPAGARKAPPLPPLFRRVAKALRPGGVFLFDLLVGPDPRRWPRRMAYHMWRAGRDWAVLIDVSEDPARARLVREITTFRRVGSRFRRASERHVLAVHRTSDVVRALRRAGFIVRTSPRYGAYELPPRRLAFEARKPK